MRKAVIVAALAALALAALAGAQKNEALLDARLRTVGGKTITLRSLLGKPIVVDFMASTCPPCIQEVEELRKLKEAYGDSVTIISISVNPIVDTPEGLVSSFSIDWLAAVDERGEAVIAAGVTRIPRILVLDAEGNVVFDHTGFVSWQQLAEAVEMAMGAGAPGQPPPLAWLGGLAAVAAGVATVLAPCSLPLLAAYAALWAARAPSRAAAAADGLAVALGALAVYASGLAVELALAGAQLPAREAAVAAGAVICLLGVASLLRLRGKLAFQLPTPPRIVEKLGPLGYGVAYGLASLGCSLPIFLSVLAYSTALGAAGLAYFTAYLASIFATMVAVIGLSAALGHEFAARVGAASRLTHAAAAAALVVAGLLLIASAA